MPKKEQQALFLQSPRLNQLNILREIAASSSVTQAEIAGRCSLSVAMVNNYMKELCRCGWLEYHRRTTKSVSYHLTPEGTQRLESLQRGLIGEMVGMFVAAKEHIRDRIVSQAGGAPQRVILFGTGHLAQLAFHALELAGATVLGVCDEDRSKIGADFCGRQVLSPSQIRYLAPDALILADSPKARDAWFSLVSLLGKGVGLIRLDQGTRTQAVPAFAPDEQQPRLANG